MIYKKEIDLSNERIINIITRIQKENESESESLN